MNDPRIILRDKLIETGLLFKDASLIALETGSSQTFVDIEYLNKLGLSANQLEITLKLVMDFYSGKLISE